MGRPNFLRNLLIFDVVAFIAFLAIVAVFLATWPDASAAMPDDALAVSTETVETPLPAVEAEDAPTEVIVLEFVSEPQPTAILPASALVTPTPIAVSPVVAPSPTPALRAAPGPQRSSAGPTPTAQAATPTPTVIRTATLYVLPAPARVSPTLTRTPVYEPTRAPYIFPKPIPMQADPFVAPTRPR